MLHVQRQGFQLCSGYGNRAVNARPAVFVQTLCARAAEHAAAERLKFPHRCKSDQIRLVPVPFAIISVHSRLTTHRQDAYTPSARVSRLTTPATITADDSATHSLLFPCPHRLLVPIGCYRQVVAPPCRIFYRIGGQDVIIVFVMRSERHLRTDDLLERE